MQTPRYIVSRFRGKVKNLEPSGPRSISHSFNPPCSAQTGFLLSHTFLSTFTWVSGYHTVSLLKICLSLLAIPSHSFLLLVSSYEAARTELRYLAPLPASTRDKVPRLDTRPGQPTLAALANLPWIGIGSLPCWL